MRLFTDNLALQAVLKAAVLAPAKQLVSLSCHFWPVKLVL